MLEESILMDRPVPARSSSISSSSYAGLKSKEIDEDEELRLLEESMSSFSPKQSA